MSTHEEIELNFVNTISAGKIASESSNQQQRNDNTKSYVVNDVAKTTLFHQGNQ